MGFAYVHFLKALANFDRGSVDRPEANCRSGAVSTSRHFLNIGISAIRISQFIAFVLLKAEFMLCSQFDM